MIIIMAAQAGGIQSQEGVVFLADRIISYELLFMAVFTLFLRMCALQFITGKGMVETVRIEADHFKISTVVVAVAFDAFFTLNFCRSMVTLLLINPLF